MSVGRFPLAALLRLRVIQQEQAAGALAAASAELEACADRLRGAKAALKAHQLAGGRPSAWTASLSERDALELAATRAGNAHEDAGHRVQLATAVWREARTRARALEHLEAKHQQARRRQDLAQSQQLVDESASRPREVVQAP
jgi:flagellar biosynthesis chaperone FliJ